MSINAHLIHRCTVQQSTSQPDEYGDDRLTWANVYTNVWCRLVIGTQRVLDTAQAEEPRVTTYKMFFPSGTIIAEGNRVASVTLEDGTVMSETFSIEAIMPRRARAVRHITCELKRIS